VRIYLIIYGKITFALDADTELLLEDWKMTKDRIKHFDTMVMKLRVQGLPIAAVIQAIAFFVSSQADGISINILGYEFSVFAIIVMTALFYLVPVLFLDVLHFLLLYSSVKHALQLEKNHFNNKIQITHKLTNKFYTIMHIIGGYGVYALIYVIGIYFISLGSPESLASITPST